MLKRVLNAEQKIAKAVGSKKGKRVTKTVRKMSPIIGPVAMRAFHCMTNPNGANKPHWPDAAARDSMKLTARCRTSYLVPSGGSAVFWPVPGVASDTVSFAITPLAVGNYWEAATSIRTGAAANRFYFDELPFSLDKLTDGVSVRCVAYHVKLRYTGSLLNRSGDVYFYENPERDCLTAENATDSTVLNGWMAPQINSPIHTRVCSFSNSPVIEHTFHPVMWRGAAFASSEDSWVCPTSVDTSVGQPSYRGGPNISPAGGNPQWAAPCGYIGISASSDLLIHIEVTAHYEYAGGVARPLSTPTPAAPSHEINAVKASVLKAKMKHCLDPDSTLQQLATDSLKEIVGARATSVAEGFAAKLLPRDASVTKVAAGIAGLLL